MSDYRLPGNPFANEDSFYEPTTSGAMLALAYEQRTANLLALWANPTATVDGPHGVVTWGISDDLVGKLLEQIQQRLGVEA